MRTLWARWLAFVKAKEGGEPLAACRILCGIGLVASVAFAMHHGTLGILWIDAAHGGYRTLGEGPWLIDLLGGSRPAVVWSLAVLTALSATGLTLGWRPRLCAAISLLLFNSLIRVNFHDGSAYDSLLTNQLFLLIWAGSGATWSIDCKLRRGSWSSHDQAASWPRQIMILQLVLCYWSTGLQKLSGHWLPGGDLSAVHYVLQDPFWRRWDLDGILPHLTLLTKAATAFTWGFEVLAPLLLVALYFRATAEKPGRLRHAFNRFDYRACFAAAGLALHVGLHVLMRIGPFSWIILSYYPALWTAREWKRFSPSASVQP